MANAKECEFYSEGQCKALIKEGTMNRDEECLNANKASCCYKCSRKDSCGIGCDYLYDQETNADPADSTNETVPQQTQIAESRAGRCPKCRGEMIQGEASNYVRILKPGDLSGDQVTAFYCRECGFVEFYKYASSKEPWRLPKKTEEQPASQEQTPKDEEPHLETSRRKMVR